MGTHNEGNCWADSVGFIAKSSTMQHCLVQPAVEDYWVYLFAKICCLYLRRRL